MHGPRDLARRRLHHLLLASGYLYSALMVMPTCRNMRAVPEIGTKVGKPAPLAPLVGGG